MNKDTTIKEEIELVDNYIYIMSIRLFKEINFQKILMKNYYQSQYQV